MSIGGNRCFVAFIDDFTRHTWACLFEGKEVFSCFLKVKALLNGQIEEISSGKGLMEEKSTFPGVLELTVEGRKTAGILLLIQTIQMCMCSYTYSYTLPIHDNHFIVFHPYTSPYNSNG